MTKKIDVKRLMKMSEKFDEIQLKAALFIMDELGKLQLNPIEQLVMYRKITELLAVGAKNANIRIEKE